MANFWEMIHRVIREADVLIMVLDARLIAETRNIELEKKVINSKKPYIYAINKSDLIDQKSFKRLKIPHSVFLSATNHTGTSLLRKKIQIYASKSGIKDSIKVGILGYPNVGKSSIINALSGRRAAPASNISGQTRGIRNVRASKIILLDTPGVIPYQEKNHNKHAMIGAIDYSKEKDPDVTAVYLMEQFPHIEEFYSVYSKDKYKSLDAIAKKLNLIAKGGVLDTKRAAMMVLKDWQTGKIK